MGKIDKRRVGFIGLGVMGGAMSRNLLRCGYKLNVFDIDKAKTDALESLGASSLPSLKDVAAESDIILTSLPLPSTVKDVYLGPEGILQSSSAGTIFIDMSTVDPETSRSMSRAAAEHKMCYLDAPVSGGFREAESGKLVIIVGGDQDAFQKSKEILDSIGSTIHYAGASGAGSVVKLVNNTMSMGNILVASEVFVLGVKAGVDAQTLFNIIRTSAGRSFHFEKSFPNLLARNFEPGFTVDLAKKDLGLAVEMAKGLTVPIPATSLIYQLYNAVSALGEGQKHFTAIAKLFESWSKVELKGTAQD